MYGTNNFHRAEASKIMAAEEAVKRPNAEDLKDVLESQFWLIVMPAISLI